MTESSPTITTARTCTLELLEAGAASRLLKNPTFDAGHE
jgi:hypothetical protein